MEPGDQSSANATTGWQSPHVWATSDNFEGNPVRQLLVPASTFSVAQQFGSDLVVENTFGQWPAFVSGRPLPDVRLALQLPLGASAGDAIRRATWTGPTARLAPANVLATYRGSLSFEGESSDGRPGLRQPQLGAVHAVLGYWTTKRNEPGTIVMPTGTGKTETMLAMLVAGRPEHLLVLVPSDALREQIAAKFERLGVLQANGIVAPRAARPVVGRIKHGFTSEQTARAFAEACNVMVATPNVLATCTDAALEALLDTCSHLFVDEAHHLPAPSWARLRDMFGDKPVVQFTATPYREDGRRVTGRLIYNFPLRMAQAQGYFSRINYTSIIDFDDVDRAVATAAVTQLRADVAAGLDHVLMARVESIARAHEVLPLYEELAKEHEPVILNSGMSKRSQREALAALHERRSRVIVCVNMLGEGFDLPALKIAALHDPRKSLGVTLQFIGRFARTTADTPIGEASAFVARREVTADKQLRTLYAEDSDWNVVIRDLSEAAVEAQQEVSDFEQGFTSLPEDINVRSLLPKMSTVVYSTPTNDWDPLAAVDFFGEENLLTVPIGLNAEAGVAWCVVEHRDQVRWGDVKTIEEVAYELFVFYFDSERQLLYINSSMNSGVFQDLAEALLGEGATRFTSSTVYRVMGDITRLTPTNVGVLDIHSQFRRFSMHVGADVTEGFAVAEARTKTQTNISANGYRDGERVNISASIKGRIWSHAAAPSLKHWCNWCDGVGTKLLDDTISIDSIIGNFLIPLEIDTRPGAVLLGVEWPWEVYIVGADRFRLEYSGKAYNLVDVDLVPTDYDRAGPFRFTVRTPSWEVGYEGTYVNGLLTYTSTQATEVFLTTAGGSAALSAWLNQTGLVLLLEGDQLIDQHGLLYKSDHARPPYPHDRLIALNWEGVDFRVESQGPERRADSIQARAVAQLLSEGTWDVVLDDDGSGEIADIVGLRIDDEGLLVKLVHCKYARGDRPGARVNDLYEVCGQANKSVSWRRSELFPFFKHLERRARAKRQRTGTSPFLVGNERTFYRLQEQSTLHKRRMEIVVAQPGVSASRASSAQLDLLASTEAYLRNTVNAPLIVWCSA
jgi:superfamily II DNA or RNA helicase